jgi:hypothetical protein
MNDKLNMPANFYEIIKANCINNIFERVFIDSKKI